MSTESNAARDDLLLAASFIESSYLTMTPRTKGTFPKPTSAYRNWCDDARIHRRAGLPRLDPYQLTQFVKALTKQYKDRHGFDALLECRKKPITDEQHAHLLSLPERTQLGPFVYRADSKFGLTWRALLSTGPVSAKRNGRFVTATKSR